MVRNQNQAIAQKLGILGEEGSSMVDLKIQEYQALNMHIRQLLWSALRVRFLANFFEMADLSGKRNVYS